MLDRTELREPDQPDRYPAPQPRPKRRWVPIGVGAAVLVAAAAGAIAFLGGGKPDTPTRSNTTVSTSDDAVIASVPVPAVTATRLANGQVRFAWTYADPRTGDFFQVTRVDVTTPERTTQPEAVWVAPVTAKDRPCVEVIVVRADGRGSPQPGRACAG